MSDPVHDMASRHMGDDDRSWVVRGFIYVDAPTRDRAEEKAIDLGMVAVDGISLVP